MMRFAIVCHSPYCEGDELRNRFGNYTSEESAQHAIAAIEDKGLCAGPHEVREVVTA